MKNVSIALFCLFMILQGCTQANKQADATPSCAENKESMLYVMNLTRKVKPEFVSAYKEAFEICKEATLKEPGCNDYGMYQSYTDSTCFVILETWKNKGEHLKHMETEHLKAYIQKVKGMGDPSFKGGGMEMYICPNVN